jgi:hypothetical protein
MMTSFLRHHTVMAKPMVTYLREGSTLNEGGIDGDFAGALAFASRLAAGRLSAAQDSGAARYKPVGYVLSAAKGLEDERLQRREKLVESRLARLAAEAEARLEGPPTRRDPAAG